MALTAAGVYQRLAQLAQTDRLNCVVAWSGGLDSTVLLHLLCGARTLARGRLQLRAIHVDHSLQSAAADFRRFCRRTARAWRVPLVVVRARVQRAPGASLEEAARDARYAALASAMKPGEVLVTAQHLDDQLETLLLGLVRGAGPAGLAAMPGAAAFAGSQLLRPLLEVDRARLAAFATAGSLEWIEDPTNSDWRFDRNYLRARLVPALRERWPAIARTASRSAAHCATAAQQISRAAALDLEAAADGADLDAAVLRRWSQPRRAAALRQWIAASGGRAPDTRQLAQIGKLLEARADAHPELRLPQYKVRRTAGRLVLQMSGDCRPAEASLPRPWRWREGPLQLGAVGALVIQPGLHGDLDLDLLPDELQAGVVPAAPGRPLRKLLQQLAVPLPQRARMPLLWRTDAGRRQMLLAVGDLWLATTIRATAKSVQRGRIIWQDAC